MNIAKQKEIMFLTKELRRLESICGENNEKFLKIKTRVMIDHAIDRLITYLQGEDFSVNAAENGNYIIAKQDEMSIFIDRKPSIFTVRMPNDENYTVSIQGSLSFSKYVERNADKQDYIIEKLNEHIDTIHKTIGDISNQKVQYRLSEESRYSAQDYHTTFYDNFEQVLAVMFS